MIEFPPPPPAPLEYPKRKEGPEVPDPALNGRAMLIEGQEQSQVVPQRSKRPSWGGGGDAERIYELRALPRPLKVVLFLVALVSYDRILTIT